MKYIYPTLLLFAFCIGNTYLHGKPGFAELNTLRETKNNTEGVDPKTEDGEYQFKVYAITGHLIGQFDSEEEIYKKIKTQGIYLLKVLDKKGNLICTRKIAIR